VAISVIHRGKAKLWCQSYEYVEPRWAIIDSLLKVFSFILFHVVYLLYSEII
jgi:hypothetical protein